MTRFLPWKDTLLHRRDGLWRASEQAPRTSHIKNWTICNNISLVQHRPWVSDLPAGRSPALAVLLPLFEALEARQAKPSTSVQPVTWGVFQHGPLSSLQRQPGTTVSVSLPSVFPFLPTSLPHLSSRP